MTEEKIKELLRSRIKGEVYGYSLCFAIIGAIVIFIFPDLWYIGAGVIIYGLFKTIKYRIDVQDDIKNLDYSSLFLRYRKKEVLIKVMDEVINHSVYKTSSASISKHFILYSDEYENIIRLYDVIGINITKLDNVNSRIDIEDRFGQKKKLKIATPKAEEIYKYLEENCKNAKVNYSVNFDDGVDRSIKHFITYDHELDEEYCFFEGKTSDSKKEEKKTTKKEEKKISDKKEKKITNKEEKIKDDNKKTAKTKKDTNKKVSSNKKSSSDIDKKYNDLKKLKELLDNDIITKEDFEKEKRKLLDD